MAHPAVQPWDSSLTLPDVRNTTMRDFMSSPPGLERPTHLGSTPLPGLEDWRLAQLHGNCALQLSLASASQRMGVDQEYLHLMRSRNERLRFEHNVLAEEHARLREAFAARVPQAPPQPTATDDFTDIARFFTEPLAVQPVKPPGVFEPTMGSFSCASTAASDEAEESSFCHLEAQITRELRVRREDTDGHLKVHWPVDARKLHGKDKQIISPSFEIFPGCSFKLMVKPRAMGVRKGQANFHKGRGWGSIELKLVEGFSIAPTLRCCISVGGTNACRIVTHDFNNSTVCGLEAGEGHFDFKSAVDRNSSIFLVSMDVSPSGCMNTAPTKE